ncbi:UHRF1-binding protein 1-like isoform X3 [Bradysia coprophila]|uniref:UHRF1-binding protein 1-like isoform X3 n=1 Tax=Bradysia coprophila TaxID=38358 RepID=UPI00187D7876|nr:UHRF1-binding protein 1-like isoform X3 [Bradysia coprophila]
MVSIIKNQLLKHLSRYTKNLSSDKINISTFGGEGELSNLQLDEKVLTELLELPGWLKLTSAWCNHVSFRISWTKLKSTPITLSLDEVNITVETCEFERTGTQTPSGVQSLAARQGKYSFIHKVIDGITIVVNTVNVNFISPAFTASVQMSRIRVESKTPKWMHGDLRVTRLKDPVRGLLLIFKELSWQTVRIEASSTQDKTLTPLRLLTNQARCRITIKKKLSDCSILSSRLVLILDDLLWVLTDSQLKAALHFVDSLAALIKESTNLTQKTKAQKKLEVTLPEYQAQQAQQTRANESATITAAQKTFNMFDVRETSYHFFSQRIDLHLCDDAGDGRSCHPDLNDGGALQISVQGFQVDYYPFHLAKSDRSHWPKYREAAVPPALWLEQSLNSFKESLLNLSQPNRPPTHAPLERSPISPNKPNISSSKSDHVNDSPTKRQVLDNLSKLMTACVILRIEDFTLYRVTTAGKKQMPKEFISAQQHKRKGKSGDKDRYSFPAELPTVHAEFTYFYFPGDFVFPLPQNKIFVHVNPIQVNFHLDSVLWFNSFALNLHESLLRTSVATSPSTANEPSLMYMDVKLEAIMPRIIFECGPDAPAQRDRPKVMQVQISRFFFTNIRELGASRADLAQALHSLQEGSLVFGSGFPSKHNDLCVVTDRILSHVAASDVISNGTTPDTSLPQSISNTNLSRYALWSEPRDVWCLMADPIWVDFLGARSVGQTKSVPFVDAVPITLWIHGKSDEYASLTPVPSLVKSDDEELNLSIGKLEPFGGMSELNGFDQIPKNFISSNPFYSSCVPDYGNVSEGDNKTVMNDSVGNDKSVETTADLHVIAHVSNLVSVQIDHYQLLFLLRLSEEMTELSTFLSLDSNRILRKETSNKSLVVGCVIPQVEVTLVMPSQTPGKESSGGDAESVIPDSASLGDDLHINNSATWSSQAPPSLDQIKSNQQNPYYFGSIETPSPITNDPPSDLAQYTSNPNTHGFNVQILSTPITNSPNTPILASSSRSRNRNSVTDSGFKELGSSLISMKKGFSQFMTSIDSALKTNTSDDMSDTVSMQSDISSDSENFIHILADDKTADCMDVMFRLNPFTSDPNQLKASPVEVASEVCEEPQLKTNMSSPSEPSEASSWRRRDLVSMATFRLTTVEVIRQQKGCSSSLRLQISALTCDECGAIPWDELQTKFNARCRAWNLAPYNPEKPPCVQLRLDELLTPPDNLGKITDKKSVLRWFSHNVEVRVKDLTLDLSMSTVVGIGDLAEDEIISKPLPLEILLENLKIHLMEDRPPVNITSPGPVPVDLNICKMRLTRDDTGTFHIEPENHNETDELVTNVVPRKDRELLSMQLVMQQLKLDNDELKKKLAAQEKSTEAYKVNTENETDILKNILKKAQDDLSVLLDEKRTLMDTVRSLQFQLSTDKSLKADGNR